MTSGAVARARLPFSRISAVRAISFRVGDAAEGRFPTILYAALKRRRRRRRQVRQRRGRQLQTMSSQLGELVFPSPRRYRLRID